MKRKPFGLKHLHDWAQNRPEAAVLLLGILLLFIGWLLGLITVAYQSSGLTLLRDVLAPLGTAAAATAAWRAIALTRANQKRDIDKDEAESKPNLIVSRAQGWELAPLEVELNNLGNFPVYVRLIYLFDYGENNPTRLAEDELNDLLPASATKNVKSPYGRLGNRKAGEIHLFFQYGATRTMYHKVAFPFDTKEKEVAGGNLQEYLDFMVGRQVLTSNFGTEKDMRAANYRNARVFDAVTKEPLSGSLD